MRQLLPHPNHPVYPTHTLSLITNALAYEGIALADALRGSNIDATALRHPSTRISTRQLLAVIRNALALSTDPAIALRAGSHAHVANCGIYGFAFLSSPTHRDLVEFALKYEGGLNALNNKSFICADGQAIWTVDPVVETDPEGPIYRFAVEMNLAGIWAVKKDLTGPDFRFSRARVAYPAPAHAVAYAEFIGCDVEFGQGVNELWYEYDAALLDQPLAHADPITHALMRELCDQAMRKREENSGLAGTVHAMLMEQPGRFPDIEATASTLSMNSRTLRRKLEAENTSYRQILDEVRLQLATNYLQTTAMTNEEIAVRLGYSDAANFRHAFLRWSGRTPSEVRRSGHAEPAEQVVDI